MEDLRDSKGQMPVDSDLSAQHGMRISQKPKHAAPSGGNASAAAPDREEFIELCSVSTSNELRAFYGVSITIVQLWCKLYDVKPLLKEEL